MRELYRSGGPGIELYDTQHADLSRTPVAGDLAFYERFARRTGGPILELACGTGRVAIPLADAGFDVTGVDLSPQMLAIARGKSKAVRWIRGNMERFSLGRKFRLILIPFRAFHHLMTPSAQKHCLESVRRHLARDGRLIVDMFDPKLDLCLPGRSKARSRRPSVVHPRTGRRWDVEVIGRINDPLAQTLRETWVWTERGANGRALRRSRDTLALRWTYRYEMEHLLRVCGLKAVACHGDFRGGPPRYASEQIWVVRRDG